MPVRPGLIQGATCGSRIRGHRPTGPPLIAQIAFVIWRFAKPLLRKPPHTAGSRPERRVADTFGPARARRGDREHAATLPRRPD